MTTLRSKLPAAPFLLAGVLVFSAHSHAHLALDSGSCLRFDGETWLQPESPHALHLPHGLTIEAWVHPTEETDERMAILGKESNFEFWRTEDGGLSTSFGGETQPGLVPVKTWTHVAAVWDTSWIRLYVDGREVGSAYRVGQLSESNQFFKIGAATPPPENAFVGCLDEIRIWYGARTPTEIRANMGIPLTGEEPTLMAYWPLDEEGAPVAKDRSGNYRDLYLGILEEPDFADPEWARMPIGLFGEPPTSAGRILIEEGILPCNGLLHFEVRDIDLAGNVAAVTVEAITSGDVVSATLVEIVSGSAIFSGRVRIETGAASADDGVLQVSDGEEIVIRYFDEDDGTGSGAIRTATAEADCELADWTPTFTPTSTQTPTATLTPTTTPTPNPNPKVHFVDGGRSVSGDGVAWNTAFKTIGEAVAAAVGGDEVWIKSGTYEERIYLDQGISLIGGFEGDEASPAERMSGGSTTLQGERVDLARFAEYYFETLAGIDNEMVIEIANAQDVHLDRIVARGGVSASGGGLAVNHSTVSIADCTIEFNAAKGRGGGLFVFESEVDLYRVIVRNNKTVFSANGVDPAGGGLFAQDSKIKVDRCLFDANDCPDHGVGGGLALRGCELALSDSFIIRNRANNKTLFYTFSTGGGIYLWDESRATIVNSLICHNYSMYGTALDCEPSSRLYMVNSVIAGNISPGYTRDNVYHSRPADLHSSSNAFVRNCIIGDIGGGPDVDYSFVSTSWPSGPHNVRGGPGYQVPPDNIDLTDLSIDVGNYSSLSAPALVDAGTTVAISRDIRGRPRPIDIPGFGFEGGGYDIGLIEYDVDELAGVTPPPTFTPTRLPNSTETLTPTPTLTCEGFPAVDYPPTFTPIPYENTPTPTPSYFFERIAYVVSDPENSTWPNPYTSLRQAVESSGANRIWVQKGVYDASGMTVRGRIVYGGLKGTEGQGGLKLRDVETNETVFLGGFEIQSGTLDGVTVTLADGGGVTCSGTCSILNCRIIGSNRVNHQFDLLGGAVRVEYGTLRVDHCYFGQNLANRGAGIYAWESTLTVTNSVFEENRARWSTYLFCHSWCSEEIMEGDGGAIWAHLSKVHLGHCKFRRNSAVGGSGGAVFLSRSESSIVGCEFEENVSIGEGGNAVYTFTYGPENHFHQCQFSRNGHWENSGTGAVYIDGTAGTFENCHFMDNHGRECGAFYSRSAGGRFVNCFFSGNSCPSYSGTALAIYSGAIDLINCTLVNHKSQPTRRVLLAPARIYNSILWNPNKEFSSGSEVEVYDSIVREPYEFAVAQNVHTTYPGFADYCGGDFHLVDGAFAIDKGSVAHLPEGVTVDAVGGPRVLGPSVDIGAFEFQSTDYNTPTPTLTPTLPFDVIFDGRIDARDLLKLLDEGRLKSSEDYSDSAFRFSLYWQRTRSPLSR